MLRHISVFHSLYIIYILCCIYNCFIDSIFRFAVKLRGKYRDFPYIPFLHTCITSLIINIPYQSGAFATTDELHCIS